MESLIIDYTGWIKVDKEDLEIVDIENDSVLIDVSKYSIEEIKDKLNKGEFMLNSFGKTYLKSIDGEDDWKFDVEIEDFE